MTFNGAAVPLQPGGWDTFTKAGSTCLPASGLLDVAEIPRDGDRLRVQLAQGSTTIVFDDPYFFAVHRLVADTDLTSGVRPGDTLHFHFEPAAATSPNFLAVQVTARSGRNVARYGQADSIRDQYFEASDGQLSVTLPTSFEGAIDGDGNPVPVTDLLVSFFAEGMAEADCQGVSKCQSWRVANLPNIPLLAP
jgi:hypothetical protein